MKYDIFISYRREKGEDRARLINKKLKEMGYKVFFDHDAVLRGQFETIIKTAIEDSKVFLLFLSEDCLKRCAEKDDFVRKEIEHAKYCQRVILPVFPQGEDWEKLFDVDGLPDYINSISKLERATIDFHENFESSFEYQIKKKLPTDVYPQNKIVETEYCGADIYVLTDLPCIVYSYGRRLGTVQQQDGYYGSIVRLRKGRHKLRFESIDDEEIYIEQDFVVPSNEYIDYIDVCLEDIYKRNKIKKAKETEDYNKTILEERMCLEQTQNYIVLGTPSTIRYARGVAQMLKQIGHRCALLSVYEYSTSYKNDYIENQIRENVNLKQFGKITVLTFVSDISDYDITSKVLNKINKEDIKDNILVSIGNLSVHPSYYKSNIIHIETNNKLLTNIRSIYSRIKETVDTKTKNKEHSLFVRLNGCRGFDMKLVEGGDYQMGDKTFYININVNDFYICSTTVTFGQWHHIMGGSPNLGCKDRPATGISIKDIKEFIDRLNEKTGKHFFMPSEEQWEYAARGGRKTENYLYSGSNNITEVAWCKDNSVGRQQTRDVSAPGGCKKRPNELGLWFMSGNVWEICTEYGTNGEKYITRGGSYSSSDNDCQVSSRAKHELSNGNNEVGFRLALQTKNCDD